MSEHGQQEGDGLAASSLGDADEVTAGHDGGDGLCLDGGGLLIAVPGHHEREREIDREIIY